MHSQLLCQLHSCTLHCTAGCLLALECCIWNQLLGIWIRLLCRSKHSCAMLVLMPTDFLDL